MCGIRHGALTRAVLLNASLESPHLLGAEPSLLALVQAHLLAALPAWRTKSPRKSALNFLHVIITSSRKFTVVVKYD